MTTKDGETLRHIADKMQITLDELTELENSTGEPGVEQAGLGNQGILADRLTARQHEILELIAEGQSTEEIAFLSGVSVKTGRSASSPMVRLDIHDVARLVRYTMRVGLGLPKKIRMIGLPNDCPSRRSEIFF
jgi:DNA-binding NarL/FixJ family response regulator